MASAGVKGIEKKYLVAGKGEIPQFQDGAKATFHYQTRKCNDEHTVLDDSKHIHKPMELIIGKKFKLEVWEACIRTMKVGEMSSFTCERSLVAVYPMVAKSMRDIFQGKPGGHSHHCCGMTLAEKGVGYDDLNVLMKDPQPLEFIFELLKVEEPGEFKKDVWTMEPEEKLGNIPKLREEGNQLYKEKDHKGAADKYAEALGMLEQLLLREKPGDTEYKKLEEKKIPLLLNYSQCQLILGDYYPVIDHTTTVLEKEPDNVKALFRRAKAHVAVWNVKDAKEDFHRVMEIDPSIKPTVQKELKNLSDLEKQKNAEDKAKLQGKMFS